MKQIFVFLIVFISITGEVFSQIAPGSIKIEFKNETLGGNVSTLMFYKKDNLVKLYRSENGKSFTTIIDYTAGRYYDIAEDNRKTGNKYSTIKYSIIAGMWHILFNGPNETVRSWERLPGQQTVAGKMCDVYDSGKLSVGNAKMQYFFYGDIMLKMDKLGHSIEAVSVDESPVFSEDEFTIPSDVNWLFEG